MRGKLGRKRRRGGDIIATFGITAVIFFFILRYAGVIQVDPSVGQTLFTLLPGLLITSACLYVTLSTSGAGRLGGTLGVGAGTCFLLSEMDGLGLLTVDMFYGLTLTQLHIWTMVVAALLGAVMYAAD